MRLMQERPLEKWAFYKRSKDIDFYLRPVAPKHVSFRFSLEVDFPIRLIADELGNINKRLKWDDGYEVTNMMREWNRDPILTQMLYVKLKAVFFLGQRDVLFLSHAYEDKATGIIYVGNGSTEHEDAPLDPRMIRINSLGAHWILEPFESGKRTKLTNISELHFGGNVPKGLVQSSAVERQVVVMGKLKKHLL